jgi:DNA-binding winged helix-turn-helix (wHTH) protein
VPLVEPHENVWAGRVVTDTAVRRTISKLRALLGDTDPETPLYIKSQMKRGDQFIGQPLPVQALEASSICPIVAVDSVGLPTEQISPAARIKPAVADQWWQ